MRAVVTGAAGYVGSYLVKKLLEDERFDEVVGIDNFLVGMEENYELIRKQADSKLKLLKGDICDRDFVKDLLKDADVVYHLAAISGVVQCTKKPYLAFKVNVEGTLNLLEASENVEYFVYPSSSAVYGQIEGELAREDMPPRPLNKYGAMKASCETLCIGYYNSYGLGTVILRFTNIYGVGVYPKWRTVVTNFILRAIRGEPLTIHGSGEQKRDFIHIDDVISMYKLVINSKAKGEIFNAGSGYTASIKELAEIVKDLAEKRGKKVELTFTEAREKAERTFGYDVSKIKKLGFEPEYDVRSGIEKTFDDVEELLRATGFKEFQREV